MKFYMALHNMQIYRVISCGRCGLKLLHAQLPAGEYVESSPAGDVD
ncbi:hypothetical protein CLOSTHATH_01390 [Hungatella hathewayi DSM 13479]|uniref:Uncharacterized protein n=1 Tax=Hungatella hathewayi DSM 13479 TaxID=566550 RepID=D3ACR2_9FIRM|nr:hypothetical protein CLOSTHATH_01390 [Hungatella hathewayi DSM 13479]